MLSIEIMPLVTFVGRRLDEELLKPWSVPYYSLTQPDRQGKAGVWNGAGGVWRGWDYL